MPSAIAVHPRPRPSYRYQSTPNLETLLIDALVFLIAVGIAFDVTLIGQLLYSEIAMLLLLPLVLATRAKVIFRKEYRTIYLLMGLWLLSQVVTDAYRGMPFDNRMKGMARVIFFAVDLMVLSALIGNNLRRIRLFIVGGIISGLLLWVLSPVPESFPVVWKMDLSINSSMFLLLVGSHFSYRSRKATVPVILMLGLAAVDLHYGARSQLLISLTTAVLLLPIFSLSRSTQVDSLSHRLAKLAALAAVGIFVAWFSQAAVHWAVGAGLYSQGETSKFETQSSGKLGVIFGGRPEGPVAVRAIMDSPILGHGSYASDPKYTAMLQDYQYYWGYTDSDVVADPDEPAGIPSHSHLTGAWVESGVLGSIVWFYLLWLICRSILRLTEVRHPLTPFYLLTFIGLFWDILFSPFGNLRRVSEAFTIILMVSLIKKPLPPRKFVRRVWPGQPTKPRRNPPQLRMDNVPGIGRAFRPPIRRRTPR